MERCHGSICAPGLQSAAIPLLLSGAEPSLPGFLRAGRPEVTDVKVDGLQLGTVYRVSPEAFYLQGTAKLVATANLPVPPGALGAYMGATPQPALPQDMQLRRPSPVYVLARINRELGDTAMVSLSATVEFSLVLGPEGSTSGPLIEVVDPR
jgi:hypothetical protein